MEMSDRDWLTVGEAAKLVKMSRWSLYKAAARGELRHVRIGGRRAIRLSRGALDEWLLRHEQEPLAPHTNTGGRTRPRRAAPAVGAEVHSNPDALAKKGAA